MRKTSFLFILLLCLALVMPFAVAEETAAYVPGETFRALLSDAFNAGLIIGGEGRVTLEPNKAQLDEADASQLDALTKAAEDIRLTGGFGKIENGYRLELVGAYVPETGAPVDVTLSLNLTADGVSIESNLLEGERVTAKWETLLALCGADQATIDQIMSVKDMDWDTALLQLGEAVGAVISEAARLAEPYADTFSNFVASLTIEQFSDVPAEGDFPAVDHELSIECPMTALADLLDTLADQIERDEALAPYLEALLANAAVTYTENGEDVRLSTPSELCDSMRNAAKALAQIDDSLYILFGYDRDEPMPCYLIVSFGSVNFQFLVEPDETGTGFALYVHMGAEDDTGENELAYMVFQMTYAEPTADSAYSLSLEFFGEEKDSDAAFSFTYTSAKTKSPDADAYQSSDSLEFVMYDAESAFGYAQDSSTAQSLTANGGEQFMSYGSSTTQISDSADLTQDVTAIIILEPADSGIVGHYQHSEVNEGEDAVLNQLTIDVDLSSWAYDPASTTALKETALETVTNDEMSALVTRLTTAAQQKVAAVLAVLPPEVMQMVMSLAE